MTEFARIYEKYSQLSSKEKEIIAAQLNGVRRIAAYEYAESGGVRHIDFVMDDGQTVHYFQNTELWKAFVALVESYHKRNSSTMKK